MNDAELLRRLADVFERFDPVPAGIGQAAVLAGGRARDGGSSTALALVADGVPGTGVRGGGRLLGFAGPGCRIDVAVDAVDADGSTVELTGLASPSVGVWVRWPGGSRRVDVDPWGRFTVSGLPAGPLSLMSRVDGRPAALGPWFVA